MVTQEWFFQHRSQGGGDPRRTSSGRVDATLTMDPSIHFHGNEDTNEILNWLRYRSSPSIEKYRQELSETIPFFQPYSLTSSFFQIPVASALCVPL